MARDFPCLLLSGSLIIKDLKVTEERTWSTLRSVPFVLLLQTLKNKEHGSRDPSKQSISHIRYFPNPNSNFEIIIRLMMQQKISKMSISIIILIHKGQPLFLLQLAMTCAHKCHYLV